MDQIGTVGSEGPPAYLPRPLLVPIASLTGELDGLQALLRTSPTVTQISLKRQIWTDQIGTVDSKGSPAYPDLTLFQIYPDCLS